MWNSKWKAISARILSLLDAGTLFFQPTNADDKCGVAGFLLRNAEEVVADLKELRKVVAPPDTLSESLDRFLKEFDRTFGRAESNLAGITRLAGLLPLLASFRAEFEYLRTDTEIVARSLSVRAFTHLQRSIVADETIRKRWQEAFENGEIACEGLGACHLLLHGVWAIKTSGEGERTDLILGTRFEDGDDVRRAADTLVLTEWKLVRTPEELSKKAGEAYQQARRYGEGILAGFELATRRYLVLVSWDRLPMPPPRQHADTVYEYRNVAVSPRTPSAGNRSAAHGSGSPPRQS